ncbi:MULTISPECIES: cysteine desulfurase family protein [Heyndrickxia]|uniref:cysteine desulfurase family protein n=1 Tax=Heyndrickxia TaxID=2837504 RepID=UPI0003692644|nr:MULTISPECIES: cysteine desulfurase family protein [Heyndrickxia]APB36545.1 cysteine desulfurase NifS [Heyndrickxia coagulans]MEC2223500.1 cysteine desulfurase family protein [Weizmannia sp. CD-2023]MED4976391.1 cysteine desulfurase family protein [Weizmannia sp. CD-2023]QPG52339.1 cysteine desulfurase [Heyndrickxia coagulans]WNE60358.1 cysteine desulfurase [Heyndrickxia coagulans]
MEKIYLDHAATSPVLPQVAEKMMQVLTGHFGNPSSIHAFGREARRILDEARQVIADSIGAQFNEIIFTSGGTEADNYAILGTAEAAAEKGKHIISTAIEHHAVLHPLEYLETKGYDVTYLQPDETGRIKAEDVQKALRDDTILVSVMYGNNEVGTIQPIAEIGELLKNHPAVFHTDAVQAYGNEKIDVNALNVDMLSVSAHKIGGPKGIGFLYVRNGTKLKKRNFGGAQELKRRPGTENTASIAGFAEAVKWAQQALVDKPKQYSAFKQRFMEILKQEKVEFQLNGNAEATLPHVLNLSFPKTDVESMLVNLDLAGIAASSGSACTAGSIEPSHVLVAMFGRDSERLRTSIRFSFGIANTMEQVEAAARKTAEIVRKFQQQ